MNRCSVCVMPDTRPDTEFVDGICSACIAYANRPKVDWDARKDQLLDLLARAKEVARQRGNQFDCIVPSSGGKDSHYQVLKLIELGAKPLVVTATTCHLTTLGRANINNLARYATTVEVTPNRSVRATLNRLGLTMVGDISWPEHVSIFTTPFKIAAATRIPFMFYGENPQNQYGGPLESQDAQQMTRRWVSEFGGFLGLRPQDLIGVEDLTEHDMQDYMLTENVDGIEAHFLGQYLPWDSRHNAEIAIHAGMKAKLPSYANWWTWENLDNAQTGLHDYGMWLKYGYNRGTAQVSVDIRDGRMTRDEGLVLLKGIEGEFPEIYCDVSIYEVLRAIGMDRTMLWDTLDRFTNWDLFRRVVDSSLSAPMRIV